MKKERRSLCRHTQSEPKNTHNGVTSHSFWHRNAINQKQIDGKRHCDSYIHFIKKKLYSTQYFDESSRRCGRRRHRRRFFLGVKLPNYTSK